MVETIYDVERETRYLEALDNLKDIENSFEILPNPSLKVSA
jgi:hypothetical protein